MTKTTTGEKIILQDKPSIIPIITIWPATGILLACPLISFAIWINISFITLLFGGLGTIALMGATIRLFIELIRREFKIYTLTETQLTIETGIFEKNITPIPLKNITATQIQYPVAGNIFNYATLLILTPAGQTQTLQHVHNPKQWQEEIQKRI